MIKVRYTAWDGRQLIDANPSRVFSAFASHLARSDSVGEALRALLQGGVELEEGLRTAGLDDLLETVRQALKECCQRLNLESAFKELWDKLSAIQGREERLRSPSAEVPRAERLRRPESTPRRLSDAIARLRGCRLEDEMSRKLYGELFSELERIRRLERIGNAQATPPAGRPAMSYRQAVALLEKIEQLKELERQLARGAVANVDSELLNDLLGSAAGRELESVATIMKLLEESGYFVQKEGRAVLSPKGVRKIGHLALREIFQGMMRDRAGGHRSGDEGAGEIRFEKSRQFAYGEPLEIDLAGTLKQSLSRGKGLPLKLEPRDFQVFDMDYSTSAATVLLLDMSWSMSWDGRFAAAKKVAMAMESLIRAKFPGDFFAIVGFFTRAVELKVADLPEASWNIGDPFTNLQDGFRLASRLLLGQRLRNRQIILVTDGQPTAYFAGGRLYCEWPLSFGGIGMRAAQAALEEVARLTRQGIRINTFMLDDSPNLKMFVERIAQLNHGRALYTCPDRLGQYVLVDYVARTRRRV